MYEKYKIEVKSSHLLTNDKIQIKKQNKKQIKTLIKKQIKKRNKKQIKTQIKKQTLPTAQRILLEKYFQTVEKNKGHVTATICKICSNAFKDSSRLQRTSRNHLKVSLVK